MKVTVLPETDICLAQVKIKLKASTVIKQNKGGSKKFMLNLLITTFDPLIIDIL